MSAEAAAAPAPEFSPPPFAGRAALVSTFGRLEVEGGGIVRARMPGGIVVSGALWEGRHMVLLRDLPLIPGGKLYVNRAIEAPLRWLLEQWATLGGYQVQRLGCFSPRAKATNPDDLSLHAYGLAFDLNPATNPLQPVAKAGQPLVRGRDYDLPEAWIAVAEEAGWTWGGHFKGRKDPMHFQWATGV